MWSTRAAPMKNSWLTHHNSTKKELLAILIYTTYPAYADQNISVPFISQKKWENFKTFFVYFPFNKFCSRQ